MTEENKVVRLLKSRLLVKPPVNEDPRTFSPRLKNFIVIIAAVSATAPGFSSTIYFPGLPNITQELNAPSIATTLTAALFVLFIGIAPVFWASFSEYYEIRRFWLLITMAIYIVSSLGNALINNIWGMVVLRCVQAVGASAGQSIGGGIIADMYPVEERGSAFGKFFLGLIVGPIIGPIIGGFLIMSDLTWRATFWFCVAFGAVALLITLFFLPETFRDDKKWGSAASSTPTTSNGDIESRSSETVSVDDRAKPSDEKPSGQEDTISAPEKKLNPIQPFLLLQYPHVLLSSLVGGLQFGSMFAILSVLPVLFSQTYGLNSWQIGLCFLGSGVGNILATVFNSFISDRLLLRARTKRGGRHKAEDRLTINLWPASFVFSPLGALLFGWSIEKQMSYWVGIVGIGIITFGMNQAMTSTSTYLLDATPGQGASATAAANFIRQLLSFALALGSTPMIEKVGPGYLSVFLAALCWLSTGLLFINKVYGHRLRRHSGFEQEAELKN